MKAIKIPRFVSEEGYVFFNSFLFISDECLGLLLCSETGGMIMFSEELCQSIISKKISNDLWFKLVQRQIAEPFEGQFKSIRTTTEHKIVYYIFDLTQKCNFRCIYCFRAHGSPVSMSFTTIERAVDKIINCAKIQNTDFVAVQLWGGEPLLEMELIRCAYRQLINSGLNFRIDIETNASALSKEIAKELYNMKVAIGVSIDGDLLSHNRQRKLANGQDTFQKVKAGVLNLQAIYPKRLISSICIITKYNFKQLRKILTTFIYELEIASVKFNIVRDNPNAPEAVLALSDNEVIEFVNDLFLEVIAFWRLGRPVFEDTIISRIRNILDNSCHNFCNSKGCLGGKKMISIATDGSLFPCEMVDFDNERLGTIFDERPINEQVKSAWEFHPFFKDKINAECNECPWLSHCRGGCTSRQRYFGEEGIDKTECLLNKTLYPLIIELILKERDFVNTIIGG